jgi:hypothetical protein
VPRVSSLSVPLFPFPCRLWLSSSSMFPSRCSPLCSAPFHPTSSGSWQWWGGAAGIGHCHCPPTGLCPPMDMVVMALLPSLLLPISTPMSSCSQRQLECCRGGWSPSYQQCCYGGGVCCPGCLSSVIVVVWWFCHPPLRSSPFCPMSMARGRGGWCCVTWAWSWSCPSPYHHCWPDCSRCLMVRVVMVAVVVLVLVVVIILHCLVSNNKMKREKKKNLCLAQETLLTSLGPFFFVCQREVWGLRHLVRLSWGCSRPPLCILSIVYSPPVAHLHHCYVTSTLASTIQHASRGL